MNRKDFKDIIRKELSAATVNGKPLFTYIDEYDREKLITSFWERFLNVKDAVKYIRQNENWEHDE